jgi:hypothetical protein
MFVGIASNNKQIDEFVQGWCNKNKIKCQILYNEKICTIKESLYSYLILNPLVFSKYDWRKFVFTHNNKYKNLPILIIYNDLKKIIELEPEIPLDTDVIWVYDIKDAIEFIEERLIELKKEMKY